METSKRLLDNGNGTFPEVRYFTQKLEFFSNILSMVVVAVLKIDNKNEREYCVHEMTEHIIYCQGTF